MSILNAFPLIFLIKHLANNCLENINEYISRLCICKCECTCICICVYVYLLSTYLEGYFMKIVTTGSIPCFLLLYNRFLNIIINFWYICLKKYCLRIFL